MINFAVVNFKTIVKNIIKFIILIILIVGIMNIGDLLIYNIKKINYVDILKNNLNFKSTNQEKENIFAQIISTEIPILSSGNSSDTHSSNSSLTTEISVQNDKTTSNTQNTVESQQVVEETSSAIQKENTNTEVPKSVSTEIVSENNLAESYNTTYGTVKIKNETSCNLTEEILTPNIEYTNTKDIIIFHTHTCESYTQTESNTYTATGNYRTTDLTHSVAQVGSVLENCLNSKGYNVIHSLIYHDYPAYNGSYGRSYNTVSSLLTTTPNVQTIIDLHRDAIGNMSNYAPCVKINGEQVAQLMFVIGTNGGGLSHDNWQRNLKYAIKIQEKANEMYPGLFRPIIIRNSRYNQNLADSAFIIEVGATGNTLEQATGSMKYLAEVISEVMK